MKYVKTLVQLVIKGFPTIFLVCALLLLPIAGFVAVKSSQAEQTLDSVNLEARKSTGTEFYARAKKIFVKQLITRKDLIEYLKSVDYAETQDVHRNGGFVVQGREALIIIPNRDEFQPVQIAFKNNRIQKINIFEPNFNQTGDEITEVDLEGAVLGTFISTINGESKQKMFVRRYPLHFEDFKDTHLFYSILASEDARFMSHNGNRFDRIISNFLLRRSGGASSLDAQVIKNAVLLDKSRNLSRKIDEMFAAAELERRFSKEEIFNLYVNHVFLGSTRGTPNIYGFLAAARQYFNREQIADLTLSETCTLVALLPEPSRLLEEYNAGNPSRLIDLRNRVLKRLYEVFPERYTEDMILAAKQEEIRFQPQTQFERPLDLISRTFIELTTNQQSMVKFNNLPPVDYSGLKISTSIDAEFQRGGQELLNNWLPRIAQWFPPVNSTDCNGQPNRLLGAIVAIDPSNGEILAMVGSGGGNDGVKYSKLALNSMSPFASDIKPLWVVKALADGKSFNNSLITPLTLMGENSSGRLRLKLASSDNDLASQLYETIGAQQAHKFFQSLTGVNPDSPDEQFAHGFGAGTEISPLKLSQIYTMFATPGMMIEPNSINQVFLNGKSVEFERPAAKPVVDPGAAFVTTQLLRSAVGYGPDGMHGTATKAFSRTGLSPNQLEIAGKTGSGPSSVYMVSISPKLVITVFVGYQCPTQVKNASELLAKSTAAEIWSDFIKIVNKSRPDLFTGSFPRPDNVEISAVNLNRRCRLNSGKGFNEYFLKNTSPDFCRR
ncbi:MAG: transglycosylase domain-containing protein [Pyrinomonadaceae bacterium]